LSISLHLIGRDGDDLVRVLLRALELGVARVPEEVLEKLICVLLRN
jgi:hypothetical protein